jgi:rhodanese-related sulfurtransferase
VLYCTSSACVASKLRAANLVEEGFSNVARFAGGLADWHAAGLPIQGERSAS